MIKKIVFSAGKLSSYKQPKGGIYFVDNIPRNASGKILRRLLKTDD
jgi:acyl-coenzyme A synthetase/AMP-(fatty) acid ligase